MTRHQYGMSSLVSQTSFCGETFGGVAWLRASTALLRLFGPTGVVIIKFQPCSP